MKKRNPPPILILAALLMPIVGCTASQQSIKIPSEAVKMEVTFSWDGIEACAHESPEIRVAAIPEGAVKLNISLKDISLPARNHGGGSVPHDGSGVIPAGSLKIGYNGPCPPLGKRHTYEFSVMAVDAEETIIGFGKARQGFPPKP